MLTRIETAGVSGISGVPWDAVELPSQFMENWCWSLRRWRLSLGLMTKPANRCRKSCWIKCWRRRTTRRRCLFCASWIFGLFDFRLHAEFARIRERKSSKLWQKSRNWLP
ncbi:M3 family metallopeptidase [Escherichia coli]